MEVQANKLAPKSELMTYLGNAPGAGGFMFMRSPNNVLFYSTHCIFDEVLFPKCAIPVKKSLTRLLDAPPTHHYHKDTIQVPVDEDMPPRRHAKTKGKEHQQRTQMSGMFPKIHSFCPISPYLHNLWIVTLFSSPSLC